MPAEKWESRANPYTPTSSPRFPLAILAGNSVLYLDRRYRPKVLNTLLHHFHNASTDFRKGNTTSKWKSHADTGPNSRDPLQVLLSIQGLGQFIQQSVQILVRLPLLLNFVDRVHHGGVMLATELASNLRQ